MHGVVNVPPSEAPDRSSLRFFMPCHGPLFYLFSLFSGFKIFGILTLPSYIIQSVPTYIVYNWLLCKVLKLFLQDENLSLQVNTVTDARLVCSSYKSPYRQSALQMYYFATRIKDELKHIESCNEILLVRIGEYIQIINHCVTCMKNKYVFDLL